MPTAAIVGAGLIGRSWAIVFARAGWAVRLADPSAEALAAAPGLIRQALDDLKTHGLVDDPAAAAARVTPAASLAEAVGERRSRAGERAGDRGGEARHLRRPRPPRAPRRDPRLLDVVHPRVRVLGRVARPRALPRRAPRQPASPRARRGTLRRALDRAGDDRPRPRALRERRAGPDHGQPRNLRLRAEPPARGAAGGGVPPRRRGRGQPAGPRRDPQGRARPALVLHGAVRDHRTQRAGRDRGLLRALHRLDEADRGRPGDPGGVRGRERGAHPCRLGPHARAGRNLAQERLARPALGGAPGAQARAAQSLRCISGGSHGLVPQSHHHLRRHGRDPHALDVAAPAGDAGGDRRRRGRSRGRRRRHRPPSRPQSRDRPAGSAPRGVHAFLKRHQAALERGREHHDRRRADHAGRGARQARRGLQARGRLPQHGLDELRPLPDAEPLQGLPARLGAALSRRLARAHLQATRSPTSNTSSPPAPRTAPASRSSATTSATSTRWPTSSTAA